MRQHWREWLVGLVVAAGVVAALLVPPLPQDPAYHHFIDTRKIAGVPNFWDVLSNIGFMFAGAYGLTRARHLSSPALRPAYVVFCVAVICVALGSAYYHYAPSTPTLVWDRLPMSVAFMALFSLVLGDRLAPKLGRVLLWPLIGLGAISVVYWAWTERHGTGDLRLYALVQFLPVILIPLLLLVCEGSRRSTSWLWCTFAAYFLAKLAEHFDAALYDALGLSGHSIKHLLSAFAVLFAILALLRLDPPEP